MRLSLTTASLSRFELDRKQGLHGNRASVHHEGLKFPLPDAVDGGPGESQRALQELGVLDYSIASDQDLQDHRALLTLGGRWIADWRLFGEQIALRQFGDFYRFDRGHCGISGLIAAGLGNHDRHLRLQARRDLGSNRDVWRWLTSRRRRHGWSWIGLCRRSGYSGAICAQRGSRNHRRAGRSWRWYHGSR